MTTPEIPAPDTTDTKAEVVSDADVRRERYEEKHETDGTALNPDRDAMYDDLTGVGESGTQGSKTDREDQNNIGPNG